MSRILVIDDELPLRQVLRSILERAGHTVFDAPDGRKGLALWRDKPVDVVMTDIFMPEKDGIEVIMEMKKSAAKPKIIAMSGGGSRGRLDVVPGALMLGADRIILKPFDQQLLLSTVAEVINGQPDRRDTALPSNAIDQRKHSRFSITLPVAFGNGAFAYTGTLIDISHEGCRIRSADAAPGVKYFRVEIQLDDPHATLTVDLAVMRWSRNEEFGVEFIRMEPDHQARLRSLIRSCEEARSRQDHQRKVQQHLSAASLGMETQGQP
jgi:DNA-binding response OmpR family regulator